MAKKHHPKRGSRGYSPRVRARREVPRLSTWPEGGEKPKIQGFAGYKAGMTHAFVVDYRKSSTTAGQEVRVPVTVVETPPMKVAAVRVYEETAYGLRTLGEAWAKKLDPRLRDRFPIPKKHNPTKALKEMEKKENISDVRVIMHTIPEKVSGVPKKVPDVMEVRIGGGTVPERLEYAKGLLGKEVSFTDFTRPGHMVDVIAVTKGKGFQGHVKRWGVKLLTHKNSKHRRMIGTAGPWRPHFTMPTVPQAGQTGYHQRTEYNKRVLKYGDNGEEVTPAGGFLHYGVVKNPYVVLHGSVPGPAKRLVRFRDPVRAHEYEPVEPEIVYISKESKQGV
ncbi:MAG: 50S ribosomal protein L3 [Thermoplasmata archaeon]|nr:50S ribosomal protein L3 [Thermoplasmata archaeon]